MRRKMYFNNPRIIVLIAGVFALSIVIFVFGSYAYPAPPGDSIYFLPTAINFASGNGLTNEVSALAELLDDSGMKKFVYYVPLFPMLVGSLLFTPSSHSIFLILALLCIAVITVSSVVLFKIVTLHNKKITWFGVFLILASLISIATYFGVNPGRPDVLAALIFGIATLLVFYIPHNHLWLPLGISLGFMGATHMVGGLILAAFVGIFFSASFRTTRAMQMIIQAYLVALVLFFSVMVFSPLSVAETVQGIIKHYTLIPQQRTLSRLVYYYFLSPYNILFGVKLLLFVAFGARLYARFRKYIASSPLFIIFTIILITVAVYTSVPLRPYNILVFSLLIFGGIIYFLIHTNTSLTIRIVSAFAIAIAGIWLVRAVVLFPFFLDYGVSLNEARTQFEELIDEYGEKNKIGIDSGLWPLSEDYKRMYNWRSGYIKYNNMGNIILLQQQSSGIIGAPPSIVEDCILKDDFFVSDPPRIFGIKIANTMPGYAFSSYQCPTTQSKNNLPL